MIKIFWCGGDSSKKNFGDELGPYIIKKLTNETVVFWKPTFKGQIKTTVIALLKFNQFTIDTLKGWLRPFEKIVFSAGSILEVANKKSIVWGSGYICNEHKATGGAYLAVRGKLTAKNLELHGFKKPLVYGDPALLLPILYKKKKGNTNNKNIIGIIPHFTEYNYFKTEFGHLYKIINLKSDKIESIIDEITDCDYILSTSLHGIIVSHAYDIPAIWIERDVLEVDGFKFKDYFSSVGIEFYSGFNSINEICKNQDTVIDFFNMNKKISKINTSIFDLQKGLLKVFPFKIVEPYKSIIE
jgi:pyruvyltransferase